MTGSGAAGWRRTHSGTCRPTPYASGTQAGSSSWRTGRTRWGLEAPASCSHNWWEGKVYSNVGCVNKTGDCERSISWFSHMIMNDYIGALL